MAMQEADNYGFFLCGFVDGEGEGLGVGGIVGMTNGVGVGGGARGCQVQLIASINHCTPRCETCTSKYAGPAG